MAHKGELDIYERMVITLSEYTCHVPFQTDGVDEKRKIIFGEH